MSAFTDNYRTLKDALTVLVSFRSHRCGTNPLRYAVFWRIMRTVNRLSNF